ncbi:MAG: hypothetical protein ACI9VR_005041, partial [Cognaticolwellia sp.]
LAGREEAQELVFLGELRALEAMKLSLLLLVQPQGRLQCVQLSMKATVILKSLIQVGVIECGDSFNESLIHWSLSSFRGG